MLQQTQVSRVLEKFGPFMNRFPTVESLGAADEADVLAAWSGLGYYRRARLLHACARAIVREHGGVVPGSAEALEALPGIGRYTAGAIASIVHGQREPIVDGNVCRVLQRLEAKKGHAGDKDVMAWSWERAERLVALTSRGKQIARFNEGLMELGAIVCTPENPRCEVCPLREECVANAKRLTGDIPAPKRRASRVRVHHDVVIVHRRGANGTTEFLLERRSNDGMWAGMWQPPAREAMNAAEADFSDLLRVLRLRGCELVGGPTDSVFLATHREVRFRVWRVRGATRTSTPERRWVSECDLNSLAISNAHRRLLDGEIAWGSDGNGPRPGRSLVASSD